MNHQRSSIQFSSPSRKSSSSGTEDINENQHYTFPRSRRRRPIKSDEIEYHSQTDDLHKHSRNVTFQLSPLIINDRISSQSKHRTYTSSEEGEVEEIHRDNYIFNDEKYRAKHEQSYGNFSSESEIYGEKNLRSSDGKSFDDDE